MATNFPIDEAQIVGLFMECICFGIYLVTLAQCLRALLWSDMEHGFKSNVNWPMLTVALLLCIFATLDVAFGLRHNLDAFVYYYKPGGAKAEFAIISYWVNVMKTADYVAQTFIGDAMLIYRCYIVYGKKWWIVIPSVLLWIAGTTSGILLTVTFATLKTPALLNTSQAVPFVDSMLALTLAMNILTTSLIVYRIWSVERQTGNMIAATSRSRRASRLRNAMRIIIESALLYTISVIVFTCTYVAGSNANYGTSDNVVQIIGISFNLIIIRVDSGRSFQGTPTTVVIMTNTKLNPPREARTMTFPLSVFQTSTLGDTQFETSKRNVEVNVSQEVNLVRDADLPKSYIDDTAIGSNERVVTRTWNPV